MANVTEVNNYDDVVYQYDTADQALGGSVASGGVLMKPIQALANRTKYLKAQLDTLANAFATKRMFGGTVLCAAEDWTTVTHNKNIPVINQSIQLTKCGDPELENGTWTAYLPKVNPAIIYVRKTPNSFTIYTEDIDHETQVDWLLFDNR